MHLLNSLYGNGEMILTNTCGLIPCPQPHSQPSTNTVRIAFSIVCGGGESGEFCHVLTFEWNDNYNISRANKQRHLDLVQGLALFV